MPDKKERAAVIMAALAAAYPDAHCELNFADPFQLLIATILSAQSTDVLVNRATPALFALAGDPAEMAALAPETLENAIRSIGIYHNKAKNIIAACAMLVNDFAGQVPQTMEELRRLPGVGRKTANVVLGAAFQQAALPVDTHVLRVAGRLDLTDADTPDQAEQDLMALWPPETWFDAHHRLIWHGRRCCKARKPQCPECVCRPYCRHGSVVLP
ncbi:MAG: endonuclease III [Gracilibacteraceae bacterium]|jgi:endonuclease-3|nr:endonuclease III [Gracilibacteraceae bacterium]